MPSLDEEDDKYNEAPSAKEVISVSSEGYNQTYIILKKDETGRMPGGSKAAGPQDSVHDVFFRCGNWCYRGPIQFNGMVLGTEDLPIIIPNLQKQQGSLRYFCNAKSVPKSTIFYDQISFVNKSIDFIATEIASDKIDTELRKMSVTNPWIEDTNAKTYFELSINPPAFMMSAALIACKTYTRGLIFISIFYENMIYVIIAPGEGNQPLLDVRFPDVSTHGDGVHLSSYDDEVYQKLTLWHILSESNGKSISKEKREQHVPKIRTLSISSKSYEQTYCIMKSSWDANSPMLSVHRDVLFRFGSWCYVGRVQLTPSLTLSDIPFVIPALRMQQSRLDYFCDVAHVPVTSPFAGVLEYIKELNPLIEDEIVQSEDTLRDMMNRLQDMGLGESITEWLEGDPSHSFFEFQVCRDERAQELFCNMELVVTKAYHASGIITITIVFQNSVYVCVLDGSNEQPLLDSRFPDVSGRGRGYQIKNCPSGTDDWPGLRKISLWQTLGALEQEFRSKASKLISAGGPSLAGNSNTNLTRNINTNREDSGAGAKQSKVASDESDIDENTEPERTGGVGNATYRNLEADSKDSDDGVNDPDFDIAGSVTPTKATDSSHITPSRTSPNNSSLEEDADRDTQIIDKGPYLAEEKSDKIPSNSSTVKEPDSPSSNSINNNNNNNNGRGGSGDGDQMSTPSSSLKPIARTPSEREVLGADNLRVARPHHLKSENSLNSRMEEIRKQMSQELGVDDDDDDVDAAPWDASGAPLGRSLSRGNSLRLGSSGKLGRMGSFNDPLLDADAKK